MPGPSVLEYARYHGLSTPHTHADLSKHLRSLSYASLDETALPVLALPSKDSVLSDSKLQLSSAAATNLADMIKPPETLSSDKVLGNPFRFRKLKMEYPLLFSDHEKDMRSFKKPLDLGRIIRELRACTDQGEPSSIDEVAFSAECACAATAANQKLHLLRLDTTDRALNVLVKSIDDHASSCDIDGLYKAYHSRHKKHPEPPVPFLTPPMPPIEIEVPSLAGNWSLEPRSDQEVAFDDLAGHLDHRVAESDEICTSDISNGSPTKVRKLLAEASAPKDLIELDIETGLTYGKNTSTTIDIPKLKLDIPLLALPPLGSYEEEASKHLLDDLMNELVEFPPSPDDNEDTAKQKKVEQELQECQSHMGKAIERERPTVNAALLRLEIPDITSALPAGPIKLSLTEMADDHIFMPYPIEPNEESRLNWIPFSMKPLQPDFLGELEGGVDVEGYLTIPEKVTASKDLLSKEAGLRFLHERPEDIEDLVLDIDSLRLSEEEDPAAVGVIPLTRGNLTDDSSWTGEQPATFVQEKLGTTHERSTPGTHESCATKPANSVENFTESGSDISSPRPAEFRPTKRPRLDLSSGNTAPFRKTACPPPATVPRAFSASSSLASFLDLRGRRFRKSPLPKNKGGADICTGGRHFDPSQDTIESSQCLVETTSLVSLKSGQSGFDTNDTTGGPHALSQPTGIDKAQGIQVPSTPEKSHFSTFPPTPAAISDSRVIVLDEALVKNRALMALLDQHADDPVRAIYRNLGGSIDLVLNPTTAVILTNVQALKQKSLPGQPTSKSRTVQDRIIASSTHYETIFILVSLAPAAMEFPSEIVNDFTAFCIAFKAKSTSVLPIWLPVSASTPGQKPTDSLMPWTWCLICQHSLKVSANMSFIDDTTLWELFLREAGINAFAAQLILGMLKRDSGPPGMLQDDVSMNGEGSGGSTVPRDSWGLRRLVGMSEQERQDMFGELVGEKCLARLSAALDSTSAISAGR